jgi:hypothetical protein
VAVIGKRYETLTELRSAYASGEVTAPLMIDNDATYVYQGGESVWDADPHDLLYEALRLLGIPWEHV